MTRTVADEARQWLTNKLGFHEADALIRREARLLRVDHTSDTALRHALVAYQAETGQRFPRFAPTHKDWQPPAEQEGLIP